MDLNNIAQNIDSNNIKLLSIINNIKGGSVAQWFGGRP